MDNRLNQKTQKRERVWANLAVSIVEDLPDRLKIFPLLSPVSIRDPEADLLLHPRYIEQVPFRSLGIFIKRFIRSIVRFFRAFYDPRGPSFVTFNRGSDRPLIISPSIIASSSSDGVKTTYIQKEDADYSNWIIFENESESVNFPRKRLIVDTIMMIRSGFRVLFKESISTDVLCGVISYINWCLGSYWINHSIFYEKLKSIAISMNPQSVSCVHEYHAHSKITWYVAHQIDVRSLCVLHAPYSRSRLWLFPKKRELTIVKTYPDVFLLFSKEDLDLASVDKPNDQIIGFSCSPRFSKWKKYLNRRSMNDSKSVLFVSSLSWWDNSIVINALARLAQDQDSGTLKILFRPHPNAIILSRDRKVLNRVLNDHSNVSRSDSSLTEDLKGCMSVLGVGSSVLDEASLMGCVPIKIVSEDFLAFASDQMDELAISEVKVESILDVVARSSDGKFTLEHSIETLGLRNEVFYLKSNSLNLN